jgi:hypothetical protein
MLRRPKHSKIEVVAPKEEEEYDDDDDDDDANTSKHSCKEKPT